MNVVATLFIHDNEPQQIVVDVDKLDPDIQFQRVIRNAILAGEEYLTLEGPKYDEEEVFAELPSANLPCKINQLIMIKVVYD